MTTCENQDYVWRIEAILQVPAVVHGVSLEPLLGAITLPADFLNLGASAWVITGGESGNSKGVRPTLIEWFRDLRDQSVNAGVPFHFKQWGQHNSDFVRFRTKHEAGRELDGRTWDEFPQATHC
jgi:protein gp37